MRSFLPWAIAVSCIFSVGLGIETVEDAAIITRQLVEHSSNSIGTMATVYPTDDTLLPGQPFSLQEYYARNGSLTLLFFPISRHSQNILGTPGHPASISITSEFPAAQNPRVSFIGNVTILKDDVPDEESIRHCYLEKHPDAKWWLPDDKDGAHTSYWARFDPHTIYFVGGFGGRHYIGYIPLSLYQAAEAMWGDIEGAGRLLVEQN